MRPTAGPTQADRGDASAKPHEVRTGRTNRFVPRSSKSQFPDPGKREWRNDGRVVDRPATRVRRGFAPGLSRPLDARTTASSTTFLNPDGTETTVISADAVRYRDARGSWRAIDPSFRADPTRSGWSSTGGGLPVRVGGTTLATVDLGGGSSVGWRLAGRRVATPRVEDDLATYPRVVRDTDLEIEAQATAVKETLVLRSRRAPRVFDFQLTLGGVTAQLRGGEVQLVDAGGTVRGTIPRGWMVDAAGVGSAGVRYSLPRPDRLRVTVDDAWVSAEGRRFPVRVDPTVLKPRTFGNATAMTVNDSVSYNGSSDFETGGPAHNRTYLKWDLSAITNHRVFGANLGVVNYQADSCTPSRVAVREVTESWSAGTGYRTSTAPAMGDVLDTSDFAYGYVAFNASSSACNPQGSLFELGVKGRDLVQSWANGGTNKGLALMAYYGGYKKYAGPSTANGPALYVTHSAYDARYKIKNPTPNPIVLQNQNGAVTVSVTNRSAASWAAGDYSLRYRVFDAKGKSYSALSSYNAATLPAMARGTTRNIAATLKAMPAGMYYLDFSVVRNASTTWFTDQQVPPVRMALRIYDVPPVVTQMYPPHGYSAPTLSPQLFAKAVDVDATPDSTTYTFRVCTNQAMSTNCVTSGTATTSKGWVVPAGNLSWSRQYWWNFSSGSTTSPTLTFFTDAPQPSLTSHLAGSDFSDQGRDFDPSLGNYSTAAIDAAVPTVGPDLTVARTYNSLDPRPDGVFGAGWSSKFDVDLYGLTNSAVVRMPDGQEVRFGRNADGTYAAPRGRDLTLTVNGSTFILKDRGGSTWTFDNLGRATSVREFMGRTETFTYDGAGNLAKVTSGNSGRGLAFTWTGGRVTSVAGLDADGVSGPRWTYEYTGNLLTRVCPPTGSCTTYTYSDGSHYRSAVLDSSPDSYWRLGDGEPGVVNKGASEIETNLGKDSVTYEASVAHGAAGAITRSSDTGVTLNGASAVVMPSGAAKKSRDMTVEVWFKAGSSTTAMPLAGYQNKPYTGSPTVGVPLLYIGTDGKLRGQFADGTTSPVTTPGTVTNGAWHHAVLTSIGSVTSLYLDGLRVGQKSGTISHAAYSYNQLGAATVANPDSWPGYGTVAKRFFKGSLDEAAVYSHGLSPVEVLDHYTAAAGTKQLSKVVLPSGKVTAQITYDVETDRVAEYTDQHGGTWKLGEPVVAGDADDIRRTVTMADPSDRIFIYEYDALKGYLLRSASPNGQSVRSEDTATCRPPSAADPRFCAPAPEDSDNLVFWDIGGSDVRSMEYDDKGRLVTIYNEIGNVVSMAYDARGNVTERTTCRSWSGSTPTDCATEYTTYPSPTSGMNPLDLRWDRPLESRDGRSSSATDNRYRTRYTYTVDGKIATQTGPDNAVVTNTFSEGTEAGADGGAIPEGLPLSSRDDKGATTLFGYYRTGDVASVTQPSGQVTRYTYDRFGRPRTQTEEWGGRQSTTSFEYDDRGRVTRTLMPRTRDQVTGVAHQQQVLQAYDADGNVTRSETSDALGNDQARVTTYDYDEHNRMTSVVDPLGKQVTYEYDDRGNKTSMVDASGSRTEFAYTATNKIAEVRLRDPDRDNREGFLITAAYAYDAAGRTVATWDAMGRRIKIDYLADDLVAKKTLTTFRRPGATSDTPYVLEELGYDQAGNVVSEKTANGARTVSYTRDAYGRVKTRVVGTAPLTRTEAYTYDNVGNVTQVDSSGDRSNVAWATSDTSSVGYGYDAAGRMTRESVTLPSGTSTTTTAYDEAGHVVRVINPRGNATGATQADRDRYSTTYSYDDLGRLVRTTLPATRTEQYGVAAQDAAASVETGYNTFGETVSTRDPAGRVTSAEYDLRGQMTKRIDPTYTPPGSSTPIVPTTTYEYDDNGNQTKVTDPRLAVTEMVYDKWGRVVKVDAPRATNTDRAITTYDYTRTGQLRRVEGPAGKAEQTFDDLDRRITTSTFETVPDPATLTTTYTYDDRSNVTSVKSPTAASTTAVYDALDQLTSTRDPNGVASTFGYDGAGRQVMVKDGLGRISRSDYDVAGRKTADLQVSSSGATGASQQYTYDVAGNVVSAKPAGAPATTFEYDARDRRTTQVEPVSAGSTITTGSGYDVEGNRTRYTDGRGNQTWSTYGAFGLESVIEPSTLAHPGLDDRRWQTSYDAGGLPISMVAPGGVTRNRTYDAAGRMTRESGSGAEASTDDRELTYDAAGRLRTLSTPSGVDTYDYNARGQLVAAAGPSGMASLAYDGDGNLTNRTDASGTSTFGYSAGRLTTIDDGVSGQRVSLGYDASGATKTIDYGSSRVRTLGYDGFGRQSSDVLTNSASTTVMSTAYGYDDRNRVTRKTTTGVAGASDNTYGYDQAARLTSWSVAGGATTTYGWDASSNRTNVGGVSSSYDERNRLVSDGTTDYSWTARGTLRSRTNGSTTESMTFDAFDRMISQGARTYRYDAADRLADAGGGSTFRYAGLDDDIISDGTAVYGRGPGGGLLSERTPDRARVLVSDNHGDVVAGFDPADTALTAVPDARTFDPYGNVTASRGAQSSTGFQGSWTDPATGDVNMKARWFDTTSGSFASRDSVGYRGGPSALANKYLYGAADPVTQNDPDGHWPSFSCGWCDDIAEAVTTTVVAVTTTVTHYATTAYNYVATAATTVYNYAKSAVNAIAEAGRWVYDRAREGVNYLKEKVSAAANYVKEKVSDGIDWARKKAEQAAAVAHRAAVALTAKTKAVIEQAAKYNPVPAIARAVAPVFAVVGDVVSAVASAPAAVVQATVDVVKATGRAVQQIYEQTVKAAGNVVRTVSTAVSKVGEFVKDNWKTIASVAAGIVVGAACAAVTAGAGSVACAMLATAVSGAIDGALNCPPGQSMASCAGKGAVTAVVAPVTDAVGCISDPTVAGCVAAAVSVAPGAVGHAAGKYAKKFDKLDGGCNCFAAGTKVKAAKGAKPIEKVEVGDRVWAKDMVTGENRLRRVTAVSSHVDTRMMTLRIAGERVRVTTEHPFHTPDRGWVMSGDLRVGDRITRLDGTSAVVGSIWRDSEPTRVYNFTVEGDHNYAVTDAELLVHNSSRVQVCGIGGMSSGPARAEQRSFTTQDLNRISGDAYRDDIADFLRSQGHHVTTDAQDRAAVTFNVLGRDRVLDMRVVHGRTGKVSFVEVKSGDAKYGGFQAEQDDVLRAHGATIDVVLGDLGDMP